MNIMHHGVGLGLRRKSIEAIQKHHPLTLPHFFECAPENWLTVGGKLQKNFKWIAERYAMVCHGLSLSIGSCDPLNIKLLTAIKQFLDDYQIAVYSEHLSYTGLHGQLYDLFPLPFSSEAVIHVAQRIIQAQDILERQIAIENISYYFTEPCELTESEFINAVIAEANCQLLLDVNNVWVNSINHGYDAKAFLQAIANNPICYLHIAGHYVEHEGLRIDSHGRDVCEDVWALLAETYRLIGVKQTVLERDHHIPTLDKLLAECKRIDEIQQQFNKVAIDG